MSSNYDKFKLEHYDEVAKQRDDALALLGELLYVLRSARLNHWGYTGDSKEVEKSIKDNFYIGEIEECVEKINKFTNNGNPDKVKINPHYLRKIMEQGGFDRDGAPTKKFNKTKKWIVKQLVTFLNDYKIGHKYPDADIGVYQEFMTNLAYIAIDSIGVGHTRKEIETFLLEEEKDDDEDNKK